MKFRLLLLGLFLFTGILAVGGRLVYLQLFEREFLQTKGNQLAIRTRSIEAHRGFIFDRHQQVLAVSTPVPSIWAKPGLVDTTSPSFGQLALLLGMSSDSLRTYLERYSDREFVYLKRRITPDIEQRVKALNLDGIYSRMEYRRYYPAGEVTSHVIGLTDVDGFGQEGVELSFDDSLRGLNGRKKVLRDRRGLAVADLEYLSDRRNGKDLSLSLDLRIQYIAYRELQKAIKEHSATSGSIILLDAFTGEVLALVNQPSYNPNMTSSMNFVRMRNRVLTDVFEPGSTIKPLVVSAALQNTDYSMDSLIDTSPGFIRLSSKIISDPLDYGVIDLKTLLVKSSQVGIARLVQNLDDEMVFNSLAHFGLGRPTGIELPGEVVGRLPDPPYMSELDKAALAYGYGINVTSIQLAQAYLTFVNQGFTGRISILKQPDDHPRRQIYPVISQPVAEEVLSALEQVVEDGGTASRARNALYRIAGKTGTVRKLTTSGYDTSSHLALFAGFVPASKPKLLGVVVIHHPKGSVVSGGQVAAPVFSAIAHNALRLLNVPPDQARSL